MNVKRLRLAAVSALAVLALAACGGGGTTTPSGKPAAVPSIPMKQSIGKGEGQLNLVAWAGYVESGQDDPKVDWVHPFTAQTGCHVNVKVAGTSDEMVTLMRTGQYDGVSASGDASLRLIYGGIVAPVNTKLVPNYKDIAPYLKNAAWNSVNGQMYGIPHGYGANVLMWRTDKLPAAPKSWSVVFEKNSPASGHITAYDSPIYIADAALYLKAHNPSLGITNPYELTQKQFNAAVNLLKQQNTMVHDYWSNYLNEVHAFKSADDWAGTSWQVIANTAQGEGAPVKTIVPSEGSTGWSDTWMIASHAQHPNCMYKWMNWIASPRVQAQVAQWFGETPANPKACAYTEKGFCQSYHVTDYAYYKRVAFWATPITNCGNGNNNCVDYSKWTQAWTAIKG